MPKKYLSDAQAPKQSKWDIVVNEHADTPTVYFWTSEGCGFCTEAAPYVEDLESKYSRFGVQVIELDSEDHFDIAKAAGVSSFPTWMFYENGVLIGDSNGWEESQKTNLEKNLGLSKSYNVDPGLSPSTSEPQKSPGCGSTSEQVAEIANGIQEAMESLEESIDMKIKKLIIKVDQIQSQVEQSKEEIINSVRRDRIAESTCKCGKRVVMEG